MNKDEQYTSMQKSEALRPRGHVNVSGLHDYGQTQYTMGP